MKAFQEVFGSATSPIGREIVRGILLLKGAGHWQPVIWMNGQILWGLTGAVIAFSFNMRIARVI